jgi:hypothetical protein
MPRDIVVKAPTKNWDALLNAVEAARGEKQSPEDTWCVVGINGAHILTVWSKPHDPEDKWVRPSNHAEERLVLGYAEEFANGVGAMREPTNYVTLFQKKSPCNFGAGSCYDLLRIFLLKGRFDYVDIVYDRVYTSFKGRYSTSSWEAIKEFTHGNNRMIDWNTWAAEMQATSAPAQEPVAQDTQPVQQKSQPGTVESGGTDSSTKLLAPRPIQLPSLQKLREEGKMPKHTYVVRNPPPPVEEDDEQKPFPSPVDWAKSYWHEGSYQVIVDEKKIPEKLRASVQEILEKGKKNSIQWRESDKKVEALAFNSQVYQKEILEELAKLN